MGFLSPDWSKTAMSHDSLVFNAKYGLGSVVILLSSTQPITCHRRTASESLITAPLS